MSNQYYIDLIPFWVLYGVICLAMVIAIEIGRRLGVWRRQTSEDERGVPMGSIIGAVFGLLAFMMAFTFSGASTRHDNRKELLLQEVNAIGTTYLRAGLLREPHKSRIRKLLREYVDIRAGLVNAVKSKNGLQKAIIRSEALLEMLWSHARNVAESDPNSEITPIFIEALNDMIDMHTKRVVVATQYRIPAVIWAFLTFVAVISMALVGFQFGLTNRRSHLAQTLTRSRLLGRLTAHRRPRPPDQGVVDSKSVAHD